MYRKLLIIVSILFSIQAFSGSENYVPVFKVTKSSKEMKRSDLQRNLLEDINHLKILLKNENFIANFKGEPEEEVIFNLTSL